MSDREQLWSGRRLHFIGVGGAGMSGYARAAHALGATVSGSDRASTPYLERLRGEGVLDALIGHRAANVPVGSDVEVIHSSAVPPDNPERLAARERGLSDRPRAELLAELSSLRRTIAVAGAHGKTTTASMIVHILRAAGIDPSWLVGSSVAVGLENSHWSSGEWLVVEADESDRSMLSLHVDIAVLTNVELDHHAAFASLEQLREAFREFLARARSAVVVWDRPDLLALLEPAGKGGTGGEGGMGDGENIGDRGSTGDEGIARGVAGERRGSAAAGVEVVPYDVPSPELYPGGSRFEWRGSEVQLSVPGAHNALNAAAALEVAALAGAEEQMTIAGLAGFTGAGRRFQPLGTTARGARVYDDYAHHPTEVAATLAAARTLEPGRLVAVFQPHLYSRTALLAEQFGAALAQADAIVLLDVYPARERAEDHPGVSGLTLVRSTKAHTGERPVLWKASFDEAEAALRELLGPGDLCVVMGAGDVDVLARRLVGRDGV